MILNGTRMSACAQVQEKNFRKSEPAGFNRAEVPTRVSIYDICIMKPIRILGCHDALARFSFLLRRSILSHVPRPLRLALLSEYGYSFFGR
jgi:hypothetical protein